METKYIRLTKTVNDKGILITPETLKDHLKDQTKDFYTSVYFYSQKHYEDFRQRNSVAGIKDVVTDKLIFDFDSSNPSEAQTDAVTLINRLKTYQIHDNEIDVYYSGNKGFHVSLTLPKLISPTEAHDLAVKKFAGDLKTFDDSLYDASQILRVPLTRHQKSGLYKIPLTVEDLQTKTIDQIKTAAKTNNYTLVESEKINPVPEFFVVPAQEKKVELIKTREKTLDFTSLDLTKKPKFLTTPLWFLSNGFFEEGDRSSAFLCLAATYKNLGFPQEIVYRTLKGVAELQAERNQTEAFPKKDLWNTIIMQVYGPNWKNGQFSLTDERSWLYKYCQNYEIKIDGIKDVTPLLKIGDIGKDFHKHVNNVLSSNLSFGIQCLDNEFPICAGSNIGIVGSASSGKTAVSLNFISNNAKKGNLTVLASLDMARNRLYEKIVYKVTGMKREEIYSRFASKDAENIIKSVETEFPNVYIFDRSSPSMSDIREYLNTVQKSTGDSVKLLVLDYFERISSEYSEDTAAGKKIAGEIQDLLNDFPDLAIITLVQPNKFSLGGGPDKPILNYTAIKGSSFLYQSFRQILSLWRPFFNPKTKDKDKYMQMAILKNDLGELGIFDFSWEGKTGRIEELNDLEKEQLREMIDNSNPIGNNTGNNNKSNWDNG